MSSYFLFLRAINVGGHNMIKMKDLALWMEQLDFIDVKTYLNSGNVIFKSNIHNQTHLAKQIRDKILLESKLDIACLVRNLDELTGVNEKLMQQEVIKPESATLFVTFLSGRPTSDDIEKLKSVNAGSDTFTVYDMEIILVCYQPYHKTKLSNTLFEKTLMLDATTRNRNTVEALLLLTDKG